MVNKLLTMSLLVIVFLNLSAQKQIKGTITGIIIDKESKQPIEFANVVLQKDSDRTVINGTTTNAKAALTLTRSLMGNTKLPIVL